MITHHKLAFLTNRFDSVNSQSLLFNQIHSMELPIPVCFWSSRSRLSCNYSLITRLTIILLLENQQLIRSFLSLHCLQHLYWYERVVIVVDVVALEFSHSLPIRTIDEIVPFNHLVIQSFNHSIL